MAAIIVVLGLFVCGTFLVGITHLYQIKNGGIILDDVKRINILGRFEEGKYYDEPWLVRHADCSIAELNEMVEHGLLFKKEKVAGDFMSDNKYMITQEGWKLVHRR